MEKNIFKLTSNSEKDWNKFVVKEFYELNIKANSDEFSGVLDVVRYNGLRFADVISSGQKVIFSKRGEFIYLISTSTPLAWENGEGHGVVKDGVVVFDCNAPVKYQFLKSRKTKSVLIPYSSFSSASVIDSIKKGGLGIYKDVISEIMKDISIGSEDFSHRLNAVSNLVSILDDTKNNEEKVLDNEFKKLKLFIYQNAHKEYMSLDYVARNVFFSRRKIQSILSCKNTTYTELLKEIRVQRVVNSMIKNRNKTIQEHCFEQGYRSMSTAAYQFKSVKNVGLKEYKDTLFMPMEH
ncbi:hypothetical protein ACIMS1_004459 [Vibrio harveyi]